MTTFSSILLLSSYWNHPRIHNLGNNNPLHASLARAATSLIDVLAYGGRDVRRETLTNFTSPGESVVDLCCGTGTSTPYGGVGVDTSQAMLVEAMWRRGKSAGCRFVRGNAETYGEANSFDVSLVSFSLHEMPSYAREKVMRNAIRVAKRRAIFVDISPTYDPSATMLSGEPFLRDYQANVVKEYLQLTIDPSVHAVSLFVPVQDHVLTAVVDLNV